VSVVGVELVLGPEAELAWAAHQRLWECRRRPKIQAKSMHRERSEGGERRRIFPQNDGVAYLRSAFSRPVVPYMDEQVLA
jgi:hypothetical protein